MSEMTRTVLIHVVEGIAITVGAAAFIGAAVWTGTRLRRWWRRTTAPPPISAQDWFQGQGK